MYQSHRASRDSDWTSGPALCFHIGPSTYPVSPTRKTILRMIDWDDPAKILTCLTVTVTANMNATVGRIQILDRDDCPTYSSAAGRLLTIFMSFYSKHLW